MNILITGGDGQLANALQKSLAKHTLYTPNIDELDITNSKMIKAYLSNKDFDFCINTAAYTQVDLAEKEHQKAFEINARGVFNMSKLCIKCNIPLIHISTDFVFDGFTSRAYTEKDVPSSINVYGATKLQGEKALLEQNKQAIIIRTSWLYYTTHKNFLISMLKKLQASETVRVVTDQIGCPTYAGDLADAIAQILEQYTPEKAGVYHYSNMGVASWYDFAHEIFSCYGEQDKVLPIKSKDIDTLAKRPPFSLLDTTKIRKTFGIRIPHWKDSVRKAIKVLSI